MQADQDLRAGLKEKISSHMLRNHSEYIIAINGKIEAQEDEVAGSEKVVKEKLKTLLTKTKQYKVIERLKERDFQKWNYHQHLMEQKEMSEMAVIRHGKEFL